ncbi:DUF1150 family protein [Dichotomicrobium thermohalophilum]|uniref:DUF1150 family protein n=1 Tax=Dichotomicrobium thermohalophilum TaxID=933063 RepID=A0A397Q3X6_9HYPH|nr:DUF1150 domain-containing protein [Dichotomicrobium thermohalophilum]RIA55623.1 hypothetical protein BXY53_0693 [Dichotomicrobium thermohalophilum]
MANHLKESETRDRAMSAQEFAVLGGGEIAYIKAVKAKEMKKLFPQLEDVPEGVDLYAVHAADGTPIALSDSHPGAVANAKEQELRVVSLH